MNTNELMKRVVELETRVAFQEQSIGDLSDVILRQQSDIDQAVEMIQGLAGRMTTVEEFRGEGAVPEPPPPHY